MPHSVFTGRVVQPGEPYFLRQDTELAVALAEEERDTCPLCGMPKAWCRDPANQFGVFEAFEEQCHITYVLGAHRNKTGERDEATKAAVQIMARFAKGKAPDIDAGLDLEGAGGDEDAAQQG